MTVIQYYKHSNVSFLSVVHASSTRYGRPSGRCITFLTSSWCPSTRTSGPTPSPGPCTSPIWVMLCWDCSLFVTALWLYTCTLNDRIFCPVSILLFRMKSSAKLHNLHTKIDHRSFYSLTIMSLCEDNNECMSCI